MGNRLPWIQHRWHNTHSFGPCHYFHTTPDNRWKEGYLREQHRCTILTTDCSLRCWFIELKLASDEWFSFLGNMIFLLNPHFSGAQVSFRKNMKKQLGYHFIPDVLRIIHCLVFMMDATTTSQKLTSSHSNKKWQSSCTSATLSLKRMNSQVYPDSIRSAICANRLNIEIAPKHSQYFVCMEYLKL